MEGSILIWSKLINYLFNPYLFIFPLNDRYRKALRMMYYADHHGFPIVTFIDTPGAYADLKSEELGQVCVYTSCFSICKIILFWTNYTRIQGEAIAHNLRTMFGLKVPIISIVIGEGGSGGALAIGCANKLLMLENAVFYVARWFFECPVHVLNMLTINHKWLSIQFQTRFSIMSTCWSFEVEILDSLCIFLSSREIDYGYKAKINQRIFTCGPVDIQTSL